MGSGTAPLTSSSQGGVPGVKVRGVCLVYILYIIDGGLVSLIEYKDKGCFSGKSHCFKATVTPMPGMGGQGKRETVIEGTWHEKSQFVKGGSGDVHAVKEEVRRLGMEIDRGG